MATIAKWNIKSFSITPKKMEAISGFTTAYAMKSDTNDDTSGTTKTNTRGRAAEEPSFSVKYMAATGSNPREELDGWRDLIGVKDYLILGGKQYGKNKFELHSVAVANVLFDAGGNIIQAQLTIKFKEDMPTASSGTSKTTKSATGSTPKTKDNPYGTATEKSKESAKSAKPTTTDKSLKNPYGNNATKKMAGRNN